MRAYKRLLRYASIDTQSDDNNAATPSTEKQYAFSWLLHNELQDLGMKRVYTDPCAYTYAFLPASPGWEAEPVVGMIAHIDTAPDFSGTGVKPQLVFDYDGGDIALGASGRVLSPRDFPDLKNAVGKTLITTDGTTLLGADDKAGVAEIMTVCETLLHEDRSHCAVAVCFTPDEEVGRGVDRVDLKRLDADYAYTVDGGDADELCYECFNAASADVTVHGLSVQREDAGLVLVQGDGRFAGLEAHLGELCFQCGLNLAACHRAAKLCQYALALEDHLRGAVGPGALDAAGRCAAAVEQSAQHGAHDICACAGQD